MPKVEIGYNATNAIPKDMLMLHIIAKAVEKDYAKQQRELTDFQTAADAVMVSMLYISYGYTNQARYLYQATTKCTNYSFIHII